MEEIFRKNLKTLGKKDRRLAQRLEASPIENMKFLSAKTGLPIITAVEGERVIPLDSLEDPIMEVRSNLQKYEGQKINRWIIVGLGTGYRLIETLKGAEESSKFFIIEFKPLLIKYILSNIDLSDLIESERLTFYWDPAQDFLTPFEKYLDKKSYIGHGIIPERSEATQRRARHEKIIDLINYHFRKFTIDLEATSANFLLILRNQLLNLPFILSGIKVNALFNQYKKCPAILVSAGPSLDRNIGGLAKVKNRAVIIAVDTVARALLKHGITPHFILSADPYIKNYFHFIKMNTRNCNLVMEPRINPRIPRSFEGRIFIVSFKNAFMKLLENITGELGELETWGSVSTMAFDLALKMGCEPIIFVGQDLAYSCDRQYCRDTYFEYKTKTINLYEKPQSDEETFKKLVLSRKLVKTDDIYGREVYTNEMMMNYAHWLSEKIKRSQTRCINATEGGILKNNVEIMPFEKAATLTSTKEMNIETSLKELAKPAKTQYLSETVKEELRKAAQILEKVKECCHEALKIKRPSKDELNLYQQYGNNLERHRREIMKIVTEEPHAEILKEGNEKAFFQFMQKASSKGVDADTIFDYFHELFIQTLKKTESIIKYLTTYGIEEN